MSGTLSTESFQHFPAELRALPQWCVATLDPEEGSKEDKRPFDPKTGKPASSTDPATWGTFDQAVELARKWQSTNHPRAAIGFVFADSDPYAVIDLDTYKAQSDEVRQLHAGILRDTRSYFETSQSGLGSHIICRGHIADGAHNEANAIEMYFSKRFMICTGNTGHPRPVVDEQELLDVLYHRIKGDPAGSINWRDLGPGEEAMLSDDEVADKASNAGNGTKFLALFDGNIRLLDGKNGDGHLHPNPDALIYASQSEADLALIEMLCFYSTDNEQVGRLFFASALGKREKARRRDYVPRTIAQARRLIEGNQLPPVKFSGALKPGAYREPASKGVSSMTSVVLTRVSDVEAIPVTWIWPTRIAKGKLTIFAGHPGLGKSQLTAYVAAKVTIGGVFPNGEGVAPKGAVIMLSCEDDVADTIRPRLEAAGADLRQVHVLEAIRDKRGQRLFSIKSDVEQLERVIEHVGNVQLVVIDPITAYLEGADSHNTGDVRAALAPMQELAMRLGVAVLVVSHLNKNGGNGKSVNAVTGSGAFVAASRGSFLIDKDPEDSDRRLLLEIKNNLARADGLAFHIEEAALAKGIRAPFVQFEDGIIELTADEALSGPQHADNQPGALDSAKLFLLEMLKPGAMPVKDVEAAAKAAGIAKKTLRNAREELGIVTRKLTGVGSGWVWELPLAGMKANLPKGAPCE